MVRFAASAQAVFTRIADSGRGQPFLAAGAGPPWQTGSLSPLSKLETASNPSEIRSSQQTIDFREQLREVELVGAGFASGIEIGLRQFFSSSVSSA